MIQLKTFTEQSLARKYAGVINQIIIHILKLERGFDYARDHDHHISDIAGWCMDIRIAFNRDKTNRKRMSKLMDFYWNELRRIKFVKEINDYFFEHYGQEVPLTVADLRDAYLTALDCLNKTTRGEVIGFLNDTYPL